jgi:hypothetical protein
MIDIIDFYKQNSIDNDFDEFFYQKEYPETKSFYQPYCNDNNISEKERLFFHWYYYGKSVFYKTLSDKLKDRFIPKVSNRSLDKPNKLAALTCLFNPCNYSNITNNYCTFAKSLSSYVDLYTIEVSFYNSFITDSNKKNIHIHGRCDNILWQKERLLNILLKSLPEEYTDVAWIDADVLFDDSSWVLKTTDLLNEYKVVQLFEEVKLLDKDGSVIESKESIVKNHSIGASGYGWAMRREDLDQINLLDNQLLGGADLIMSASFMNRLSILKSRSLKFFNNLSTYDWISRSSKTIDMSANFVNQSIRHLYHGNVTNRQYPTRQEIVQTIDPQLIKINENNIWSLNQPLINHSILKYFSDRNEDDNIL